MSLKALIKQLICLQGGLKGRKIALLGDLGSGKTHLVKALVGELAPGLAKEVASPSFSLFHCYEGEGYLFHHFDLYRVEDLNDLEYIEIYESLENPQAITLIEWADAFEEILAFCSIQIKIQVTDQERRLYFVDDSTK